MSAELLSMGRLLMSFSFPSHTFMLLPLSFSFFASTSSGSKWYPYHTYIHTYILHTYDTHIQEGKTRCRQYFHHTSLRNKKDFSTGSKSISSLSPSSCLEEKEVETVKCEKWKHNYCANLTCHNGTESLNLAGRYASIVPSETICEGKYLRNRIPIHIHTYMHTYISNAVVL